MTEVMIMPSRVLFGKTNRKWIVEWYLTSSGNFSASAYTHGSAGQYLDEVLEDCPNIDFIKELHPIWKRWHLNELRAGCEHQREMKWDECPIDPSKPLGHYGKHFEGQKMETSNMLIWIKPEEHPEGLLTKPCPECGYRYGTEWKKEEIPQEIQDKIRSWEKRYE